jgi:hypothetical protein
LFPGEARDWLDGVFKCLVVAWRVWKLEPLLALAQGVGQLLSVGE